MLKIVNGRLMDEDFQAANFVPHIEAIYREPEDASRIWCRLTLIAGNTKLELDALPFDEIESLRFSKIFAGFYCPDQRAERCVRRYICKEIAERLQTDKIGIIFTHMGWVQQPNGGWAYVAGDRVIGNVEDIDFTFAPELRDTHLSDMELPNAALLKSLVKLIKKQPDILIPLISYAIRSLLNTPFLALGFPLRFITYLLGEQGIGKTTTATKFALPFDTKKPVEMPFGLIDAGSTPAALRRIFDVTRDSTLLLDDIAKTADQQENKKRRNTASQLIRFVANAAGRQTVSGNHVKHLFAWCGMVVTAELQLMSESDITRCVILVLFKQMKSLTENDRELTASVYSRFLEYFARNYENLSNKIKSFLDNRPVAKESPRQQQHFDELEICFRLLLDFAVTEQALTPEKAENLMELAYKSFDIAYSHNCEILREMDNAALNHPGRIIWEAINDETLKIVKNIKKFKKDPDASDGFWEDDSLIIHLSSIADLFTNVSGRNVSEKEAGKTLRESGLVAENGENRTASWKREGLPRMVKLDKKSLKKS